MEEAVQADRVIVMDRGAVQMDGTPRHVFSHVAELLAMGLDVPVAAEMAVRLREKGIALKGDIITKEELGDRLCPSD